MVRSVSPTRDASSPIRYWPTVVATCASLTEPSGWIVSATSASSRQLATTGRPDPASGRDPETSAGEGPGAAASARELGDRVLQRSGAERRVLGRRELRRRMAAARRADEEHPRRHARERRVLRVVSGAGDEPRRLDADRLRGAREDVADARVERRHGDALERLGGDLDAALRRDAIHVPAQLGERAVDRFLPRRADVEREHAHAGNDVLRARADRDLPHRAHRVRERRRDPLERDDDLARRDERILARAHDRRARVILTAAHGDEPVVDAHDVAHDPERDARPLEARALLDVQLQVGADAPGIARGLRRVAGLAERAQRVRDGDAVLVATLRRARRQLPERGGRPEKTDAEARALLIRPRDHLDGPREARARLSERDHRLDRAAHAESSVESPALGDRVDVAADEDDRIAGTVAREADVQVGRRVAPDAHAVRRAPRRDDVASPLLVGSETETRHRCAGPPDRRELIDAPLQPRGVGHGAASTRTRDASSSGPKGRPANTSRSIVFAIGIARAISSVYRGCRRAVSRARSSSDSTAIPPRRSATYTTFSSSPRGAVAGSRTV